MDRFLSSATNRIDAKGRVSVPAPFRSALQRRDTSELYALRALGLPAMDVGGQDLLDRFEKRIALEDPFGGLADDMSFYCHGEGSFLRVDAEGRISVPDFVREHTGITDSVTFIGRGHFFQMWEPAQAELRQRQVRERLLRLRTASQSGGTE